MRTFSFQPRVTFLSPDLLSFDAASWPKSAPGHSQLPKMAEEGKAAAYEPIVIATLSWWINILQVYSFTVWQSAVLCPYFSLFSIIAISRQAILFLLTLIVTGDICGQFVCFAATYKNGALAVSIGHFLPHISKRLATSGHDNTMIGRLKLSALCVPSCPFSLHNQAKLEVELDQIGNYPHMQLSISTVKRWYH